MGPVLTLLLALVVVAVLAGVVTLVVVSGRRGSGPVDPTALRRSRDVRAAADQAAHARRGHGGGAAGGGTLGGV